MPQPPAHVRPQVRTGNMWVRRTFPKGEEFEQQNIEVGVFATDAASAYAKVGRTLNMGNYESFKLEVGITLPCYLEEIQEGIDVAFTLASRKLGQEVRRVAAELKLADSVSGLTEND
jgi:hypothetical protein